EQVGAIGGKVANFAREDGFIADKNAEFIDAGQRAYFGDFALVKDANFARDTLHHAMNQGERFIFAEGDQVPLVVHEYLLTLRIDQQGAVVWRLPGVAGRKFLNLPFDDAG